MYRTSQNSAWRDAFAAVFRCNRRAAAIKIIYLYPDEDQKKKSFLQQTGSILVRNFGNLPQIQVRTKKQNKGLCHKVILSSAGILDLLELHTLFCLNVLEAFFWCEVH